MKKYLLFGNFILLYTTYFAQAPKLVVGVVVDQMCYEYLHRFENKFSKDGFNKLKEKGAFCSNTHYNYVPTFTAPGHASIYTGTTPADHGIIANDWYDRYNNTEVYCVEDNGVKGIGTSNPKGLRSPKNLMVNTITDQLKLAHPSSKVISVSIKDRSAILPGGHLSNGSFWYDNENGNMISSSFYGSVLPAWVTDFNNKKIVESHRNSTWDTYYDITSYHESMEDNNPYEVVFKGKETPTFPYSLQELSKHTSLPELFIHTPFANTYLTDFALTALSSELLGQDNIPDFLCISYSSPDIIGHEFGPYSKEIEDTYIRLDLEIARLLKALDKQVGKGNYVLFLTADHAVVPVPQQLSDQQLPGGYFYNDQFKIFLKEKLEEKFHHKLIEKITNNNIYLDDKQIEKSGTKKKEIINFIKGISLDYPEIKYIFTSEELTLLSAQNKWKKLVEKGFKSQRSGDLVFILESGYLTVKNEESLKQGTSHGSAYTYDTQVPLLFFGKNIPAKRITRTIEIVDIAPTIAQILNITQPSATTGKPITEILFQK